VLGAELGQLGAHLGRHLFVVTVQPAPGRFQHRHVCVARLGSGNFCLAGTAHFACVGGHHLVAVGNDGLQRQFVCHGLHITQLHVRHRFAHLGQPQRLQRADVEPANVKFIRLDRQLG